MYKSCFLGGERRDRFKVWGRSPDQDIWGGPVLLGLAALMAAADGHVRGRLHKVCVTSLWIADEHL
jgi:hypothetical protein